MKKYMKPTIGVVELVNTAQLLSGSALQVQLGDDYEGGTVLSPELELEPLESFNIEFE